MAALKWISVVVGLCAMAACGAGTGSLADGGGDATGSPEPATTSGGFTLAVRDASLCGTRLQVTISLRNQSVSSTLNASWEHFSVLLANQLVIERAHEPGNGDGSCLASMGVSAGGTLDCDLVFEYASAPQAIRYDDGAGHTASAPVTLPTTTSPLANTSWSSTTVNAAAASDNVMALSYQIQFGADTTVGCEYSRGAFAATLTVQYNPAGHFAGCREVTSVSDGTFADDPTTTEPLYMSYSTHPSSSTPGVLDGCADASQNGTHATGPIVPLVGEFATYMLAGDTLTITPWDSGGGRYSGTWVFTRASNGM